MKRFLAFLCLFAGLCQAQTRFGGVLNETATTVTFSATPTFNADNGNLFKLTLTGNVTSSTLSNAVIGQPLAFEVCQDGTGSRTFVPPTNVSGWVTISSTASTCTMEFFMFDGINAMPNAAAVPSFTGDISNSGLAVTVAKVDGVSYPSGPSTHSVPVVTAANTVTYKVVPDCTDTTGNHINYTQSSDSFSCGTSVPANTVTTTGTQTISNKIFNGAGSGNSVTLLNAQDTLGNLTGSGSAQTVYTYTIPANTVQAGKGVRLKFWATNNNAVAVTYAIVLGTTTLFNPPSTATSGDAHKLVVDIWNNAGVQNAQVSTFEGVDATTNFTTATNTSAENFANALVLKVTASEANPNTITPRKFTVELIQ